jgi:hypothetical protein
MSRSLLYFITLIVFSLNSIYIVFSNFLHSEGGPFNFLFDGRILIF